MPNRSTRKEAVRLDSQGDESQEAFNDGKMWIGRHSADGDVLVFDPTRTDSTAGNVHLYSLTQFRPRAFSRSVVERMIPEVTDPKQLARAKKQYEKWAVLKAAHEDERAVAREEAAERQRESALEHHRAYLQALGVPYEGVREVTKRSSRARRSKCRVCGIALDNFAGVECVICSGTLCSCGACACAPAVPGA